MHALTPLTNLTGDALGAIMNDWYVTSLSVNERFEQIDRPEIRESQKSFPCR